MVINNYDKLLYPKSGLLVLISKDQISHMTIKNFGHLNVLILNVSGIQEPDIQLNFFDIDVIVYPYSTRPL